MSDTSIWHKFSAFGERSWRPIKIPPECDGLTDLRMPRLPSAGHGYIQCRLFDIWRCQEWSPLPNPVMRTLIDWEPTKKSRHLGVCIQEGNSCQITKKKIDCLYLGIMKVLPTLYVNTKGEFCTKSFYCCLEGSRTTYVVRVMK